MRPVTLRFTRRSRRQLGDIYGYIHERNPEAAPRVIERIRRSANLLCDFPDMAPHGLVAGTRELVVVGLPYVIVFRPRDENSVIEILGVYHSAQDRERDLR
jgi:addiction module RelE/StbE family toxin